MKRIFNLTGIVAVFAAVSMLMSSCSQPMSPDAPPQQAVNQQNTKTLTQMTVSTTIANKSSEAVNFTINLSDGSQQNLESAANSTQVDVTPFSVIGVVADGVNVPLSGSVIVKTPDGKAVNVSWTDGVIIVTDTAEMN